MIPMGLVHSIINNYMENKMQGRALIMRGSSSEKLYNFSLTGSNLAVSHSLAV